ncbi:hypothetical protein [Gymnodinialimonas ulvae]|uniref:hypothetical protein n=1 Tax=Gymnodinialimonas ulvae TaxID=3126504 RepID=UPI0030A4543E
MSSGKKQKTLTDADISTVRPKGRRGFLGLMAAGGAAGAVAIIPTAAAASDADNGVWEDAASCPRGSGGTATGATDADTGAITDAAGQGRGAPYC